MSASPTCRLTDVSSWTSRFKRWRHQTTCRDARFAVAAGWKPFGNAGRNVVIGPGLSNLDMSLQRNFRIREDRRIEFRWEVFNLLNTPHFDIPGLIAFSPNFGRIFSTAEPSRQMQLGLKMVF